MFKLLGLSAMIGLSIGVYKFLKKRKSTLQEQKIPHCEQENC